MRFDEHRLDLDAGLLSVLAGFDVWAVPAATIAVPGLLVLLWIALQAGGAMAWVPAARRFRSDGGPAVARRRRPRR